MAEGSSLDTSGCAWHPLFVVASIAKGKLRIELSEAQQRRSRARSTELDERLLVFLAEIVDNLPEILDSLVRFVKASGIDGVMSKIIDVDACFGTPDQKSKFDSVEHPQPLRVDEV